MSQYQAYYDEELVFRKPLWRRVIPILLLLLVWLLPLFLWKGPAFNIPGPLTEYIRSALDTLNRYKVTLGRATMAASGISIVLLFWLFWGLEKLIITPDVITRRLPLGVRRTMRWTELDEVLIDHVEARFEGEATIRKILTLYAVRRRFMPFRRAMRISNSQFDDYEEVERLAMEVSIPAIARRRREEIVTSGRPALFPIRSNTDPLVAFLFFVLAVTLAGMSLYNAIWPSQLLFLRPYTAALAVVLMILSLWKLFFRQIGIDFNHLYIMRRGWVRRRIPIESIADVRVRDNQMRIFALSRGGRKPKQVFRTRHFVRNRGVLLSLIREGYEARQSLDMTPIPAMRSINPDEPR